MRALVPLLVSADPTATPSPSAVDPASAADITLSDYYLAVLILLIAVAVIVIALVFAYQYHAKLFGVINTAVKKGGANLATTVSGVGALSLKLEISGPDSGEISTPLTFALPQIPDGTVVSWTAVDGTPSSGGGTGFVTSFATAGDHSVTATFDDDGTPTTLTKVVSVTTASAPAAPASAPVITLPFVIKNWGRLVIVIFGVGVIAALMATRILDAAAGIGILGALLGVGAVTATGGSAGDKSGASDD